MTEIKLWFKYEKQYFTVTNRVADKYVKAD